MGTGTGAASELGLALIGAPREAGSPSSIAERGPAQEQDREQDLRQDRVQDQHQDQDRDQDQDQEQEPHQNLGSRYTSPQQEHAHGLGGGQRERQREDAEALMTSHRRQCGT